MAAGPTCEIGTDRWNWLTPRRCRLLLIAAVGLGFLLNLLYLRVCPFDLSGDEAQYWDWSRQLDLSYYSKGPGIAYIIRASCAIFGDTMPAVRLPALLFAAGSSICAYWLTRKLFGSDRLALGVVLLMYTVPLFQLGSILITIDSPLFFLWGLATCFAAVALFDGKRWPWVPIGIAVGLGALVKYAMLLWLVMLILAMLCDRDWRRMLRSAGPWVAAGIALLCLTPVVVWNARHGWVSALHVSQQTGATGGRFNPVNVAEFIGSQIGVLGPGMFAIIAAAALCALRQSSRQSLLLFCFGVPFFTLVLLSSLLAKAQANWASPAYFTLLVLAGAFLAQRLSSRFWRACIGISILTGVFVAVAHYPDPAYPLLQKLFKTRKPVVKDKVIVAEAATGRSIPTAKFIGYADLGQRMGDLLRDHPGAFVVAQDYQTTAELAFYTPGQPRTFCVGAYFTNPGDRKRLTQYDMWPDRRLDQSALIGRDAFYVGHLTAAMEADLRRAFSEVEALPPCDVYRRGVKMRTFRIWRCTQFKGMSLPTGPTSH